MSNRKLGFGDNEGTFAKAGFKRRDSERHHWILLEW
jgi:hypothetical protein